MSDDNYNYGIPYPPARSRNQLSQSNQQSVYPLPTASSSVPYYELQATAAAATTFGGQDYRSQRYTQQPSSNSAASYAWYRNSSDRGTAAQETGYANTGEVHGQRSDSGLRTSNQAYVNGVLGDYACSSSIDYASNQGDGHRRIGSSTERSSYAGLASNEGANVRVPYQPYSGRDLDSARTMNTVSGSSQPTTLQEQSRIPAALRSAVHGARSYTPPVASLAGSLEKDSYQRVSANTAVSRTSGSSMRGNTESTEPSLQNNKQVIYSPPYGSSRDQPAMSQNVHERGNKYTATPSSGSQGRKQQGAAKTGQQRPTTLTPPLAASQPSTNSQYQANSNLSSYRTGTNPSSTPARSSSATQSRNVTQLGNHSNPARLYGGNPTSQGYNRSPVMATSQTAQSAQTAQHSYTHADTTSSVHSGSVSHERAPSPDIPTTVDPSYVYNSYHEYQKQIEAADAEHARLAKLKAERDASEAAAAAAVAVAKILSQGPTAEGLDSENDNVQADKTGSGDSGVGSHAPNFEAPQPGISPSHSVANQTIPNEGQVALDTSVAPGDSAVAVMQEEMRLMVEKMREFQKRDPKLFSHVWESVKKTQSPVPVPAALQPHSVQGSNVTSLDPQTAQLPSPASTNVQHGSPSVPGRSATEGSTVTAKPPRQRKSRSKSAVAERAAERAAKAAAKEAQKAVGSSSMQSRPTLLNSPIPPPRSAPQNRTLPVSAPPAVQSNVAASASLRDEQHPRIDQPPLSAEASLYQDVPPAPKSAPQSTMSTQVQPPIDPALKPANAAISTILVADTDRPNSTPPTSTSAQSSTTIALPAPMTSDQTPNQSTAPKDLLAPAVSIPAPSRPKFSATQPKAGVLWPEEHKEAIAATAAKVLNAIPENADRKIAAFQIRDMLGYNPSYIELCELIEGIGLKIDRARFAKTLLAVIPEVNAQPAQVTTSRVVTPTHSTPYRSPYAADASPPFRAGGTAPGSVQTSGTPTGMETAATPGSSGLSQPASNKSGPRGPYRKTAERLSNAPFDSTNPVPKEGHAPQDVSTHTMGASTSSSAGQTAIGNSSANSTPRRGPGRPRKDDLPPKAKIHSGSYGYRVVDSPLAQPTVSSQSTPLSTLRPGVLDTRTPPQGVGAAGNMQVVPGSHNTSIQGPSANPPSQPLWQGFGVLVRHNHQARPLQQNNAPPAVVLNTNQQTGVQKPSQDWRTYSLFATPPAPGSKTNISSSSILPLAKPAQLSPKPLTKEMAARKRTFSEIIDLTADVIASFVNDHPLIVNKVRRAGDTNENADIINDGSRNILLPSKTTSQSQPPLDITKTNKSATVQQLAQPYSTSAIALSEQVPNPFKDFEDIVKPINISVALRKSRYDPKTIARDVLITTAQHPFQRGLNAHLEQLKGRFLKVNDLADLSTFRWDLVDPGGPPVGSANMSQTQEPTSAMPTTHGPSSKTFISEGVKIPSSRSSARPSQRSNPSLGHLSNRDTTPAQPSGLRHSSTMDSNFAVIINADVTSGSEKARSNHHETPSVARRGRPPRGRGKRIGRPPKQHTNGPETPVIPEKKKIGRPRIHPLPESGPKRPKTDPNSITPKFVPFLCEWKDCKAELHNLDTLRKHIFTVHNKLQSSGQLVCQWGKCGTSQQRRDETTNEKITVHENYEFNSLDAFKDHVEKAHMIPLAWHLGDGPRGSTLGSYSECELFSTLDTNNQ
jgi:hypothetical protein